MKATMRRALAAVFVVLVLGQLATQRWLHRGAAAERTAPRVSMRLADGVLHMGHLTLQACNIGGRQGDGLPSMAAWCTRLAVPEDWDSRSGGRRIELAVAIVPATAASPNPDLVTFLDGGPGGAARDDYPAVAAALAPLRERHAILLVDQRGTGGSNPLDCPALQAPETTPTQRSTAQLKAADEPALMAQRLMQCLMQLQPHAAPEFYTTTEAVRDLEAVRLALGAPRLDLIAVSYGTRVAQQFAARFPGSVRSVVLDSPVPNRLALLSEHARNLEHALQLQFGRCRATPACAARFQDPYATLYRLRDRLQAGPVAVTLPDPVTFAPLHLMLTAQDLAAVVRFDAYNELTAALLPLMLDEAQRGNYVPLLGQKTLLTTDLGDHITGALELSVVCAEDADLLAPRPEDARTLLGNEPITSTQAACRLWPKGRRPADFHAPLHSSLPVLVLDGQFDPVTPPAYGAEIVAALPHARQLIAAGQGHSVIGAGCMPRLVQRFVETLETAQLDAGCLAQLGPVPAFIDYDGASP
ncbi:MAG TPA: alpha/beta fold hydrolase [Steroidobacteraceae bacterium]|jgi:pimeloyl-ACP methyl ester carboxylesterase|nr:alpha/beta fold hydrolase [Steroidobacteraceae bacterium]